ncbi:MAG TPA: hypothetical protein VI298_01150 [Geobacteraceae bacterium]
MDTYTIDVELEHYYGERLAMNNREAGRRFYVRAAARFHGAELEKYLRRVRSHARVYASLSRMLQSPFRHMETPLFLSSMVLCAAGVVMIATGEFSLLVAGGTSAGVVGMIECSRKLVAFWQRHGVREAVFRELAESLPEG